MLVMVKKSHPDTNSLVDCSLCQKMTQSVKQEEVCQGTSFTVHEQISKQGDSPDNINIMFL